MLGRGGRCPGALSVGRSSRNGCVLSDGRFAVLGGMGNSVWTSSCEALTLGSDEHWSSFPPMHDSRDGQCSFFQTYLWPDASSSSEGILHAPSQLSLMSSTT
mmetsp:Transcript_15375/g.37812  ORF Transcript_15375/g.37812 Transcript_15375/m.37812 type:complete len:102 (-) Transcript_15375:377-682(-)